MAKELETEREDGFNLEEYGVLFLAHWYWFVASVIVTIAIAVYYLLSTTPIYTSSTQLLIRDDKQGKGGAMSSAIQEFQNMGLITSNTNVKNEILTISAPILMQETTKRLHLDLQMSVKNGLRVQPLYNDAPVTVTFAVPLGDEYGFSFVVKPVNKTTAKLTNFTIMGEEIEGKPSVEVKLGSEAKTPIGNMTISATPSWDDSYIGKEIKVNKFPVEKIGALYSSRLSVALSEKDATVVNLTITDEIPARASDVLLTLIDVYNEKWVKDKNRMAESTSEFISERLEGITKELEVVDDEISDYKSKNLLPDIQAAVAKDMQQSAKNQDNLLQLNNQLSMAQFLRERLEDKTKQNELLPSNVGLQSSGVDMLISDYNRMMLERISYVENSNENAPVVKDIDRRLASQKTAIVRSIDNLVEQIRKQIANVRRSDAKIDSQIATNPQQAKILLSVQRQQSVKEALYIFLLQKREENELSRTYTAWNTSIIQPPTGPAAPTSPRKAMVLLVAFVLGLAIPGGILFLRETLNHAVRGRKDLESLDLPLVGEIPDISTKKHWWTRRALVKRHIVVKKDSKDLFNEAMRIVRTNLGYYLGNKGGGKVVMFTSFNPGSGKSFLSGNLSAALAFNGKKVLVVDLDLRHCSLTQMAKARGKEGLSSYLAGQIDDIDSMLVKNVFADGVDVLPSGVIPPNPTELLEGERLGKAIAHFRDKYDLILLDCPPIDIVADASIIKEHADITIFVVRAGVMDRRALPDVQDLYEEKKYNNLTIILNGTKYISGKYGNYRYGYGYGYGYNFDHSYYSNKKS